MSMSQDALLALARSLSGKGNVTSADINSLLSPETGMLTDTFYGSGEDENDEEFMYLKYAPNFRQAMNLTDDNIRKIIANELAQGAAPWDVRRQIEEYTAAQADANPGVINQDGETKDLLSFADKVYGEINSFSVASQERSRRASADDPFAAGGLPSRGMDFAPEQLAPDMFDMLNTQNRALAADTTKFAARGQARGQALRFLESQKSKSAVEEQKSEDGGFVGFRESISRNLANTPYGRGETGIRGLLPLLKNIEQIPASAYGLFKGVTDPVFDASVMGAKSAVSKVNLGKDPIGQAIYGRARTQSSSGGKNDGSFDRAEDARFGRTAQGIVDRSENVAKDVVDTDKKSRYMKQYTDTLGMLLQAKARAQGFTPYEETITARSNFLRSGGM